MGGVWKARLMVTPNLTPTPKEKDPSQDGEGEEASSWVGSWVGGEGSRPAGQT